MDFTGTEHEPDRVTGPACLLAFVVSGLRGVLIVTLIVWNRTNKCVRFFSWRKCRGAGVWLFSRFSENVFDLGVEMRCHIPYIISFWEMNTRDAW